LGFDVIPYLLFVDSYSGYEVASAPERSFGEFIGLLFYPA
jgi:hypothetical protein